MDPATKKLYAWETEWRDFNRKQITMDECRQLVRKACKVYKVPPPTVMSAYLKCRISYYHSLNHTVVLVNSHQNTAVALHEAAHAIVNVNHPRAQDHGPTFAGIYLNLLTTLGGYPPTAVYASARKAGVTYRRKKARSKRA